MAGQIKLVTDLQTQARVAGNVPAPGDNGWASAGASIAKSLHAVGEQVGQLADAAAKREGEGEGRQAGLDPEFRTLAGGTLYADAYNRTGLDISETRLKTAIDSGIDGLEQKHEANPQKLGEGIDAMLSGVLKHAPDELKPKLQMLAGHKKLVAMRGAAREQVSRTRAEAAAAQQTELTEGFKALHQLSFKAGLDAEADKVVGERIASLEAAVQRRGIDGKPLIDPKQAQKLLTNARETVAEARLKGAFDRLPTVEAKASFITQLEDDWKNSKGYAANFDLNGFQSLLRELEGEMRRAESGRNVVSRTLANQIKTVQEAAERGLAPAPDDMIKLRGAVVGNPTLAADLAMAESTWRDMSGRGRLPPNEQQKLIDDTYARLNESGVPLVGHEIERLRMAEKLIGHTRAEIKQDRLGWAARVKLVDLAPLDTSSPQAIAAALPIRVAQAEEVAQRVDEQPEYLRPDERKRLTAVAAQGGAPLLDVTEALASAGPDRSRRMFAELYDSGASTLAVIGGLIQETGRRLPVVQDVADGVALSRTKEWAGVTEQGKTVRTHQRSQDVHQGALAGLPKMEQALIDATNYAYAIRLQRMRKTDDPAEWSKTYRELLGEREIKGEKYGGVTRYRGQAIIVPPDIKQDGFESVMAALKPTDFASPPVRADRSPATQSEIRQANLEPVGAGRFYLNIGNAESPQYLGKADGGRFVLDLKEVKGELIKRRPELFLDGAPVPSGRR